MDGGICAQDALTRTLVSGMHLMLTSLCWMDGSADCHHSAD